MSLVVSLRVPDGIVVAADSLSTAQNLVQIEIETLPRSQEGGGAAVSRIPVPPIPVPFSASSFTQKLIRLGESWAVSSCGQGIINDKSTYYHLRQFEQGIKNNSTLEETVDRLKEFFESELTKQYPRYQGEMTIVQQMWALGEHDQRFQFQYGLMSLQDAVDLCEFYIDTTAAFQRFTNRTPTVGGDVDVALITPFHGFQWLKRTSLMEILDRGTK